MSAGVVPEELIATMAPNGIVFALSNPDPEIHPDVAAKYAAVVATGRSDFPNQINNVLAFPGVFRGALDAGARRITEKMMVAAAEAIFSVVSDDLALDRIVPSPLDLRVGEAVANAVARLPKANRPQTARRKVGRLAALLLAAALAVVLWAGCAIGDHHAGRELVVGSGRDAESMLLAGVYLAALRSYGFAARTETADDPMAEAGLGRVHRRARLHRPDVADLAARRVGALRRAGLQVDDVGAAGGHRRGRLHHGRRGQTRAAGDAGPPPRPGAETTATQS